MTRIGALTISILALAGCASAHESGEVGTGIYELEVRGDADACSPARITGRVGEVGIVQRADVLSVALPSALGMTRTSLSRAADWHGESDTPIDGCSGAWVHREITLESVGESSFEIGWTEEWNGLDTCAGAAVAPIERMPVADCRADLVLRYRLMEACGAPCELRESDAGPRCVCG